MVTLKPPFRANDMNGLYKRVLKGAYPPIESKYSKQLGSIISRMLQVDPNSRPSCKQILESKTVREHALQHGIDIEGDFAQGIAGGNFTESPEDQAAMREGLLKTIVVPNNLANLAGRLPKANYSVQDRRSNMDSRQAYNE